MRSCKLNKVFLRALWLFLIASCSVFQYVYGQYNENYETATIFCVKDFNGQEAELSEEYFFRLQNIGRAIDSLAIAFVGVFIPEKTVFFLGYETESLALQKKKPN